MAEQAQNSSRTQSANGLKLLRCLMCNHSGAVSIEGIHLVFRTGNQFYCTYSSAPVVVEVVVSPAARAHFSRHALSEAQLVRHAVAWALLAGNRSGTIHLTPGKQDCTALDRYLTEQPFLQTEQPPSP